MFIVIEKHGGWQYASIVSDEDGNNKVFDNFEDAQTEADECQDGIVIGDDMVEVSTDVIKDVNNDINTMKYLIKEMYTALKEGGNIVHIGDLVCKVLNIGATFYPSGKIEEHN